MGFRTESGQRNKSWLKTTLKQSRGSLIGRPQKTWVSRNS